ncbi:Histidine phosphatase superfamily (branch 1) [Lacunisphaera limnophila]|uniref:Histidine phosphatase superfamily (Branch 1) n=1 Tax=Lacunisphaera limnophila TaxID=1838286 RepID=A0A1I7PI52_9BACT|nr:histidine phosphatase family protein [Lacunisphaera limnophila]AOS43309.1 Histidine phosphatase superfamily (branch 1) [Lacunisphaera limnophila]
MQGHELLATLNSLTAHRAVAAVLRHAARHPIIDPREPLAAELTAEGLQDAEAFGARITGFDRLRVFHSPVKRCQQTAERIAAGAGRAGLAVELVGPQPELGVAYILDQVETGRLSGVHGEHFVRLWFTNQVPVAFIERGPDVARRKLAYLQSRLRDPSDSGRRLDLHISHDWNVIILRELLLGVRHEEAGWAPFLDGVAFTLEAEKLRAFYRERKAVVP